MRNNFHQNPILAKNYVNHHSNNIPTKIVNNQYTLVLDQKLNKLFRKYEINTPEYFRNTHLNQWRKKIVGPIPKIIQENRQLIGDDNNEKTCVLFEHIDKNIKQIPLLNIQQIIYCMSEMVLGYKEILSRLGAVSIESQFCGINCKGQILVWIGRDISSYFTQSKKLYTDKQVITKIINILQQKSLDKNHLFFLELKKLSQFKFRIILEFLMAFKNKNKLKITPKIVITESNSILSSNLSTPNNAVSNLLIKQHILDKNLTNQSSKIRGSHSESRFSMSGIIENPNNISELIKPFENRYSIAPQRTSTHISNSISQIKQSHKINFNYSQKRHDLHTPRQSQILHGTFSQKNIMFTSKVLSDSNPIRQFTVQDYQAQGFSQIKKYRQKKAIHQIYTIYYIPQIDKSFLKTEQDLRKSKTDNSQGFPQQNKQIKMKDWGINPVKISMTTNHRSAITQSFQSLCRSSNEQQFLSGRKHELFNSNNSHRSTYSILKQQMNHPQQNPIINKNHDSSVFGNFNNLGYSHKNIEKNQQSSIQLKNDNLFQLKTPTNQYTFGGLITTRQQPVSSDESIKQVKSYQPSSLHKIIQSNLENSLLNSSNKLQVPSTPHFHSSKSIDQIYKNLYLTNTEKKSMIVEQPKNLAHHLYTPTNFIESYQTSNNSSPAGKNQLNPSALRFPKQTLIQRSYVIDNTHPQQTHTFFAKKDVSQLRSPQKNKLTFNHAFDYNQWKGIKGLLHQCDTLELKESIHCGPEIKSPSLNVKLELLGKFGREIQQSFIPNTPHQNSRTHSYDENDSFNQSFDA